MSDGRVPGPAGNVYAKYTTRQPLERRMMDAFLRHLDEAIGAAGPVRALIEVGTGEGAVAERSCSRLPGALVIGVDLPDARLTAHWRDRRWVPAAGDAYGLPFCDGAADVVLAIEVLEHLAAPGAALHEMARVARNRIVLSVPWEPIWRLGNVARGRYLSSFGNTPGHVQHWGRQRFVEFVSSHLDVIEVRRPLPWTLVVAAPRRAAGSTATRQPGRRPA